MPFVYMKAFLTVIFLIILCGTSVFSQKTSLKRTKALQLLTSHEPKVRWSSRDLLKADFDYDGVVDYALTGKKGNLFVVGIVKGSLTSKSKHWTLKFSQDAASQGALCSIADARISIERFSKDDENPDVRKLPGKSRGINLSDKSCDSFHIYYNRKEKKFVWWRR